MEAESCGLAFLEALFGELLGRVGGHGEDRINKTRRGAIYRL